MDVLKIDNYLPRGKEYQDKIKALERKKIHEARQEHNDLKVMIKSKTTASISYRKELETYYDKVVTLKNRLKRKAEEAKDQISKALALG